MKKRIGNDFQVAWMIKENGVAVDLSTVTDLEITTKHSRIRITIEPYFKISNGIAIINFTKEDIKQIGIYYLLATYRIPDANFEDGYRDVTADIDSFEIVSRTDQEKDITNQITSDIAIGFRGDSAYQVWLDAGNVGTEADYLASLKGDTGNGIQSITLLSTVGLVKTYTITFTDLTTTTFTVTDGADGHSPVITFVGTTIYVDGVAGVDLKGEKGDTGNGIQSITLLSTVGLVKTYRVTYTNNTTYDYTVTDGESTPIVQTTGASTTDVMSQKAVTDELTGVKNRFTNGQKPGISLPNTIMSDKIPMSFRALRTVGDIDLPDELTNMGITRAAYITKSSTNIEFYPAIGSAFVPPQGSYLWKSYFLYCSHPIASVPSTRQRLAIFYTDATQEWLARDVTIHKIRNGFFQVVGKHLIPTNAKTISHIWLECVFETDNSIPSGTICAITGIDVQYSVSDNIVPRDGIIYSKIKELESEMDDLTETVEIATKDKISVVSDVTDGALEDLTLRNYTAQHVITDQTDPILNGLGLHKYQYANKGTNVEVYYWFYPGDELRHEITNKFISYNGKYCKVRYYIYTKSGVFPVSQISGRLGISCNTSDGAFGFVGTETTNGGYEITKITDEVYRLDKVFKIEFTGTVNYIFASTVWEDAIIPVDYVNGDFGVTGLSMKFGETADELNNFEVIGDWEKRITPAEVSDIVDDKLELIQLPEVYNNVHFNLSKISPFLIKHQMREVDEYNQLSITMVGDSIFGRVDKGASWNPSSPEISYTPDTNGGVGNGYVTGHFPPNMWEQVVGYKVLQDLQFPHADVKYYNHVASEIVKTGTWVDRFPVGADCIRTATMESLNANAVLTFGGASFVKFIYSGYGFNPATRKIKVTFSDDNGVTWKTPSQLSLTESITSDAEGSGIYYIPAVQHKWGNFIWGGLNKTTNYKIKVEKLDSVGTVNVWGFETWSNPRVNVIITAEGANTAASQILRWERFYSKLYNPSLIIYELPYLNDLGVGMIQRFKGNITSLSSNPGTPVLNDFWHSNVAGTLTNFGGLTVLIGDYIEWNGTSWVHGSTELKTQLNKYKEDNETVFKRLATLGCPVLTLITHNSNVWATSRPFAVKEGLTILRNLVSKYGFASIDLNYYQMNFGYATGMYSDGTHLNDTGVELYRLLIAKLLKINPDKRFVGASEGVVYKKRIGSGSGAGTIDFGFEFSTTPIVRIYGNSEIAISSITQSGFTVTGSGAFDWEAYIN